MKNIIFIAPPAAGKGSISDYLVKNYGYEHLSTGDLLRKEVASGSSLGKEIDALISKGAFVSDELIIRLVEEKLSNELSGKLFILDGFPRTLEQALKLDEMLISMGITNNVVLNLNVSLEEAMRRAIGRVVCSNCGRSFNTYYKNASSKVEGICDDCGAVLEKRSDDTEETFKRRYQTYVETATPIIEYYKNRDALKEVNVEKSQAEVVSDILTIINEDNVNVKRRKSD